MHILWEREQNQDGKCKSGKKFPEAFWRLPGNTGDSLLHAPDLSVNASMDLATVGCPWADKSMFNKAEWSDSWFGMSEASCFSLAFLSFDVGAQRVLAWLWLWSCVLRASHRCWVVVDLSLSLYWFGAGRPVSGLSLDWDFFWYFPNSWLARRTEMVPLSRTTIWLGLSWM